MVGSGDRAEHFPAIERRHGHPVSFYFQQLEQLGAEKYPEQIAHLRETHGLSRTHANAVVMTYRGSPSSRRHEDPAAYFAQLAEPHRQTARAIFAAITTRHPDLELVIAWNQPMLRAGATYVFGLSASKNHLTINPWSTDVLDSLRPRLTGYRVNVTTFVVPADWDVDAELLDSMVRARLAEID